MLTANHSVKVYFLLECNLMTGERLCKKKNKQDVFAFLSNDSQQENDKFRWDMKQSNSWNLCRPLQIRHAEDTRMMIAINNINSLWYMIDSRPIDEVIIVCVCTSKNKMTINWCIAAIHCKYVLWSGDKNLGRVALLHGGDNWLRSHATFWLMYWTSLKQMSLRSLNDNALFWLFECTSTR